MKFGIWPILYRRHSCTGANGQMFISQMWTFSFLFFWLLHKSFFSKSKCTLPHSKSGSGGLGKVDAESKHCNSPSLTLSLSLSLSPHSLSSSTNATFGRILFLRSPLFWRETILRPLEGCTLLKCSCGERNFFCP